MAQNKQKNRRSAARDLIRTVARGRPRLKRVLTTAESRVGLLEHTIAAVIPEIIRPRPRNLTVAITAHCNLRCIGCRYGRDFMPGQQLPLEKVKELLEDAKSGGIERVRLYGGEPLLHPRLPDMIRHSVGLGLSTHVNTNGILLRQKIDQLYQAGLRGMTIGFYGTGDAYDGYVQRSDRFARLENSIATVRDRYGAEMFMQLNFLLMRPSCNLESLETAWRFAERYDMIFHTDLVHYSLPYFTEGPDRMLQFRDEDRPAIVEFVRELAKLKEAQPHRIKDSLPGIWSIPDWLLKGPAMKVPCDVYELLWVGADGTVQLCYVTFRLGNIYERRLRDMLFTDEHRQAAVGAFSLNCPNCHCERDSRVQKHLPSFLKYGVYRQISERMT
jgi:MoaA/NifB/PqqE/SkfB family radical SAM enzyme